MTCHILSGINSASRATERGEREGEGQADCWPTGYRAVSALAIASTWQCALLNSLALQSSSSIGLFEVMFDLKNSKLTKMSNFISTKY